MNPTTAWLLLAIASAAQSVNEVPPQFLATWNGSDLACAMRSDGVLEIHADHVLFHETHGRVVSAVTRGEREVMLVLEMTSEGETWLSSLYLTLEGDVLVQRRDVYDSEPVRRIACPGTRAAMRGRSGMEPGGPTE